MLRLVVTFFVSIVVGRWGYAEIKLACPEFLPIIDYSLNKIQVPTHDKWSMAKFGLYLEKAGKYLKTEEAYANQQIELDYSNGVAAMNWKEDIRAERNS